MCVYVCVRECRWRGRSGGYQTILILRRFIMPSILATSRCHSVGLSVILCHSLSVSVVSSYVTLRYDTWLDATKIILSRHRPVAAYRLFETRSWSAFRVMQWSSDLWRVNEKRPHQSLCLRPSCLSLVTVVCWAVHLTSQLLVHSDCCITNITLVSASTRDEIRRCLMFVCSFAVCKVTEELVHWFWGNFTCWWNID